MYIDLPLVLFPDSTFSQGKGLVYFEQFLGLDGVAVQISGVPIRFTAGDSSYDSAPAAQMWPHCCCMRDPHTRQCVVMPIINITRHFASCKPKKSLEVHKTLFPARGLGLGTRLLYHTLLRYPVTSQFFVEYSE